jgi:hypothetical protein
MGLETRCRVGWQGTQKTAAIHLDSTAVEVRGRPRLVFPLTEVRHVAVADGEVTLETDDGTLTLELGAAAELWARKIAAPPTRCKKLGIQPGVRVSRVGLVDAAFEAELVATGAELVGTRAKADVVLLQVDAPGDLAGLITAKTRINPDGAIWVIRTKGKAATVAEAEVRQAARAAGLVDVKVAAFSETLSADKLVIPAAHRLAPGTPRARAKRPLLADCRRASANALLERRPHAGPAPAERLDPASSRLGRGPEIGAATIAGRSVRLRGSPWAPRSV